MKSYLSCADSIGVLLTEAYFTINAFLGFFSGGLPANDISFLGIFGMMGLMQV